MKRKVVPKKKVLDEQGVEWEVVDQRKTIIVDESDDSEDSGSGDSEMAFADKWSLFSKLQQHLYFQKLKNSP